MNLNTIFKQYNEIDISTSKSMKEKLSNFKILSCLIMQNNKIVFSYYKNNKVPNNLQTINSCTKSVISTLIGIAIDKGLINSIHTPISEFFGEVLSNEEDLRKRDITIEHLLTMTPGFHWPEFEEWNCFSPMVFSNDINKFILQRPLISTPGEKMNYNSGCSHLLSAIIQKVTNMTTHQFAKENLFDLIGIKNSLWHEKQGISLGADGLRITSMDMIKFGNLYLNKGNVNGKQIISEKWIEESTAPRYLTYKNIGEYGYHWWVSEHKIDAEEIPFYFALGFGGQYIIIIPKFNVVVVFTSRIYQNSLLPLQIFKNTFL